MRNIFILLLAAVVLMGCSSDDTLTEDYRINFIVAHPSEIITRATSTRFEVGDKIGNWFGRVAVRAAQAGYEIMIDTDYFDIINYCFNFCYY